MIHHKHHHLSSQKWYRPTLDGLKAKDGVYLKDSYGGYVVPAKGQFYFTCQLGYFIENGEITDMMGNVGMSGMTLEVLQNTFAIGNKW